VAEAGNEQGSGEVAGTNNCGRVQKTDATGTTVYLGKLYVCENGSCSKMIFAGSNRVAQKEVTGGAVSYYHPGQRSAGPNIYVRWIYS